MTDCAVMGVDWRDLTWWEYQARLYAWNEAHSPDKPAHEPDAARLRRLMELH